MGTCASIGAVSTPSWAWVTRFIYASVAWSVARAFTALPRRRDREGCLAKSVERAKDAMRCLFFFSFHDG